MNKETLSNSRVVVVTGIGVVLFLLLSLGALFSLGSIGAHDGKAQVLSSKAQLLKLEKKLSYTKELNVTYKKNQFRKSQVVQKEKEISSKQNEIQKNKDFLESTGVEIAEVKERFSIYRNKYKLNVRSAAVGEKLRELTLLSGKTYKDVFIKKADDLEVVIANRHGSQAFRYDELPSSFRERFQPSELVAEEMLEEQRKEKGSEATTETVKVLKNEVVALNAEILVLEGELKNKEISLKKKRKSLLILNQKISKMRSSEYQGEKSRSLSISGLKTETVEEKAEKLRKAVTFYQHKINAIQGEIMTDELSLNESRQKVISLRDQISRKSKKIDRLNL